MASVLIVDDDPLVCEMLSRVVRQMGEEVKFVNRLGEGLAEAGTGRYDIVFLDVLMPDGNGLEAIPRIKAAPSSPEVIIITGFTTPDGAELAIKNGAWDYLPKRATVKGMILTLKRAIQYRENKASARAMSAVKRPGIVGESEQINACLDQLAEAAHGLGNILITGETGTGKELLARAAHANSPRSEKAFVVVDCASLPDTLVASTLFGHVRGAFTGAELSRTGLIKGADGGTLFLDEVGELPPAMQKAFLRVLEEHRFRPLGSDREVTSDFRLIAATNRNLEAMVEQGRFRPDLLFRLKAHLIHIPPLCKRLTDLKELTLFHVAKLCDRKSIENKGVSSDLLQALAAYEWPGNVRELVNVLEQAVSASLDGPTLYATHLPLALRIHAARATLDSPETDSPAPGPPADPCRPLPPLSQARQDVVEAFERQYLRDLLALTRGSIKEACRIAGISRQRLHVLQKKYDLGPKR
ncbi:MAG: sigma-54 dependent transcriptional regulator [Proteobacteria bacterium]|nr:sigma-54 dependent transcriptional regulator [Pseudomonadota bacterium]